MFNYGLHEKTLGLRKTLNRGCTGKQKELLLIRLLSVIKFTFASCPEFELELYEKINQAWSCWRPVTSPKGFPCWILPRSRNQVKTAINTIFLCLTCKITHKYALCIFTQKMAWTPVHYHISVSIRTSAKRGHCMRAEQECCLMTD